MRLVVEAIDLVHDFVCHFVDPFVLILLAHGGFGDGIDERVEGGAVNLSTLVDEVAGRLTAVIFVHLNPAKLLIIAPISHTSP